MGHAERERERESRRDVFSLPRLLEAYLSCRKHKRNAINALKFEENFETELLRLRDELCQRTYMPSRSICFVVTHPKLREVFAADFRDRVVHHLLINEISPYFERRFIYDSCACRKNKGCHFAIARLKRFVRCVTKNGSQTAFYGQFDIKSFFSGIEKRRLFEMLATEIRKSWPEKAANDLLWVTETIVTHDPTTNYYRKGDIKLFDQLPAHKTLFKSPKGKGLPIGNLTSQFFANVYLNKLDQFVKRELKVKYYLRYVDDMVLFSKKESDLPAWRDAINNFLQENLELELHPKKDKYGSVYQGIDFVGYVVKPSYVLARQRIVRSFKKKLYYFNKGALLVSNNQSQKALPLSRPVTLGEIKRMTAVINSYYGHFKQADCYNLRRNMYESHFGVLKHLLEPQGDYDYFLVRSNDK
jgi:RNA-directed DNA polymerase